MKVQTDADATNRDVERLMVTLQRLSVKNEALATQVKVLTAQLLENKETVSDVRLNLAKIFQELRQLEASDKATNTLMTSLEKDLSVALAQITTLKQMTADLTATVNALKDENKQLLAHLKEHSASYYNILDYGAKANDPDFDNAVIINELIDKLPANGGTIYIPNGDFYVKSSIKVDRSYVSFVGENTGLRSGIDPADAKTQHGGGGARLLAATKDPLFLIGHEGPRLSGITFKGFQLRGNNDGMGIKSYSDTDRVVIDDMVINNVGIGVELKGADAPVIRNSWIAETRTGVRLIGSSQQAEIKNNSLGAQPDGVTLELENADRYAISNNNIYPDGSSAIRLYNPVHGTIVGNTISSYYNGIIEMLPNNQGVFGNGNVISSNVISVENWKANPLHRDEKWGIVHLNGYYNRFDNNIVIANGAPENYTGVLIMKGDFNRLSDNSVGLGGISSNAKVVINGGASYNLIRGTVADNEFQNGNNATNVNQ